jgi:hypothetical protein
MTPGTPALKSARLLDQVQERARYLQYNSYNLKNYIYRVLFYFLNRHKSSGMRHTSYIGMAGVEALLGMVAAEPKSHAAARN